MAKLPRVAAISLVAGAIFISQMGAASAIYDNPEEGKKNATTNPVDIVAKSKLETQPVSDRSEKATSIHGDEVENGRDTSDASDVSATAASADVSAQTANCIGVNALKSVVYKADGKVIPRLRGNVDEGDVVTAEFVVADHCANTKLGMAAYQAVSPRWVPAEAKDQVLVDSMAGTYSPEGGKKHKLEVTTPSCYFQVDFFTGVPVAQLDERGGYFDGNLISADNDGSKQCEPPVVIEECPTVAAAKIVDYAYTINAKSGVKKLDGNVKSGDKVEVEFTIAEGCQDIEISLVAYEASSDMFSEDTAEKQVLFDSDTGKFDEGTHTLEVDVPDCFFQVDFVRGPVITKLGPKGTNNFYGKQGRLIDATSGGQECTVTTEPPVRETTTTTSTTSTSTTSTTVPFQPETQVLGETITKPAEDVAAAELAKTGVPSGTGSLIGLGSSLTLIGAALHGAAARIRRR